jgi:hypothetical protein
VFEPVLIRAHRGDLVKRSPSDRISERQVMNLNRARDTIDSRCPDFAGVPQVRNRTNTQLGQATLSCRSEQREGG